MTDQQMDARLREAGERWRAANPGQAPTVELGELEELPPAHRPRRSRYFMAVAAAAVVALVVGLTLSLRGSTPPTPTSVDNAGLQGNVWLVSNDGRPSTASLYISRAGVLVADDDCRVIGAKATVTGNRLALADVTVRLKPCVDQYGPGFYEAGTRVLRGSATFHIDARGMTIKRAGVGSLRFVLAQTPIPPPSLDVPTLTGTDWVAPDGSVLRIDPRTGRLSGGFCAGRAVVRGTDVRFIGCPMREPVTYGALISGSKLTLAPPRLAIIGPPAPKDDLTFEWRPTDASIIDPASLTGHTWHLQSVDGSKATAGTLRIANGAAVVDDGCATYRRSVRVGAGTFKIAGRAPAHACTNQADTADSFVFNSPAVWAVRDGKLIVYGGGAQAFSLVYGSAPSGPPASLNGDWALTGVLDGGDHSRAVTAAAALQIDSQHVTGSDGCRSFSGTVATHDDTATFELTMPEPACSTRIEQTASLVDQVLGGPVTLQVGPTSLILHRNGVGTLTFAKSATGQQDPGLLLAHQWQVRSITFGSGPYRDGAPSDDPATLSFTSDRYTVAHTCYLVSGNAQRLAGTVRFSGGTADQHSCPAPPPGGTRNEAAQAIDAIISGDVRWTVNDSTLTLETNDGKLVLAATGGNVSDLVHSTWRLSGTEHGTTASSAIGEPTLSFPDDSTLSITRCYTSEATVDIRASSMTVSGLHVTKALPCPSGPPGTQEQNDFVDSVLNGDLAWSIDGDQLTLKAANGDALMFTRQR